MSDASESKHRKSKSEQTKHKIINTFLELMLNKQWNKITVKEICTEADITRGTFYQYYSDIYDLMEQIETTLLDDISHRYKVCSHQNHSFYYSEMFDQKFDYTAPQYMKAWFKFCKKFRKEMISLLNPKYGDTYFVKKLKSFLSQYINEMMDADGMPHDALRNHFVRLFTELHFLAVRSWMEESPENFLSITDIISLLNTMRVGANYLHYRAAALPDFDIRMMIPEEDDDEAED